MDPVTQSFVAGAWRPSRGTQQFRIVNPYSERVLGTVLSSGVEDVDDAVAAAARAFPEWSQTAPADRADMLETIAVGLKARGEEIARSITREVGSTIGLARSVQTQAAINSFEFYAALIRDFRFSDVVHGAHIEREAIGVVAAITPWNFPLLQINAKVAPALAAGCAVVLKPSEMAPTSAAILAEVIAASDLPSGVFNLIWGDGPTIGEALAGHHGVDAVSFTGSTAAGRRVAVVAAQTIKRVTSELGGKSAAILLDDTDFETAIAGVLETCFVNAGQSCTAHSRFLGPAFRDQ